MKTINHRGILLGLAFLGATTFVGLAPEASAAPRRDNDVKEERKDVKNARKDLKDARKDVRKADTARERADAHRDLRDAQRDLKEEKREVRQERQENRAPVYRAPVFQNRPWGGGYGYQNNARSFTGTVTRVRSDQSFDVRIGGNTFNVFTVSRVPRGLDAGDTVRVYGVQQFNNDIRNASVSILNNR